MKRNTRKEKKKENKKFPYKKLNRKNVEEGDVLTDENVYQMLKSRAHPNLMGAEEWKKKRLRQLKKEGKNWSR